ncbi:Serine/threonine-protein phosphatase 2A regulatory subunit B'' subunit alpha [Coemansia sp. IMI 203386]|nr:Serine/threonine-protein phosphatase 2A regulatory subunit B'' subunit alpha [Coemansia sp. IMI 203386]
MSGMMGSTASNASAMTTPQRKAQNSHPNPLLSSPILQADELCLNPRWSPHLKSPPPNSTISSRLRLQGSPVSSSARTRTPVKAADASSNLFGKAPADSKVASEPGSRVDIANGPNPLASPLNKRARILQTNSPESLPPLSPVVSNRKRAFRSDQSQDSGHLPFSPTASGLRIRYSPSSPMSPSLRATPGRGEPESPTLNRMLLKGSPALSLDDKLDDASSSTLEDESPSVSQMSRSLLFRLDLQSPTSRRGSVGASDDSTAMEHSPTTAPEIDALCAPSLTNGVLHNQPGPIPLTIDRDIENTINRLNKIDDTVPVEQAALVRKQPISLRRPKEPVRAAVADSEPGSIIRGPTREKADTLLVPQFFISPLCPRIDVQTEKDIQRQLVAARRHFDRDFGARESDFIKVTETCGLPRFANRALFRFVTRDSNSLMIAPPNGNAALGKRARYADSESWPPYSHFCSVWTRLRRSSADMHALLFNVLVDDATKTRPYLTREDIKPLVTDVVDHHYELEFLEGQGQFAQSYAETVLERIFYVANRSWDGRITLSQFRQADILGMLRSIEDGIDVEVESPGVFSYKHFYVLFCSFFELDSNRDRLLDARDLLRYFSGTLSRRIISRIMMGKGKPSEYSSGRSGSRDEASRSKSKPEKRRESKSHSRYDLNVRLSNCRMTYNDFIWFLLSEIDKSSPAAVEYWFRCLDLDGDGVLSVYELEYFYDEQVSRMEEEMASDMILLDDLMCQLSDLVRPQREGMFTLKDLRRAPTALLPLFFDAFMNLSRFVEHETKTSFLQRQLAQISLRALPTTSFKEVIQLRMDFLANLPNPWVEFADMEYAALLNDHEEQDTNTAGTNDTANGNGADVLGTRSF